MNSIRRILLGVGIGVLALVIFGLLDKPREAAPASGFWKDQIPSTTVHSNAAYHRAIADARSSLLERMRYFGTPGLSVAVAVNHEVVWLECFGYSDIEKKTLITPSTKFRIGSVSKALTAAAIARLVDQKQIDLDASASPYLPHYPGKEHPFTVRQLAAIWLVSARNEKKSSSTHAITIPSMKRLPKSRMTRFCLRQAKGSTIQGAVTRFFPQSSKPFAGAIISLPWTNWFSRHCR